MSDNPPIEFAFPELRKWEKGAAPYIHVFESGKPGPTVMVAALTHGNEVSGAVVVDALLAKGLKPRKGTLILGFNNIDAYHSLRPAHAVQVAHDRRGFQSHLGPARPAGQHRRDAPRAGGEAVRRARRPAARPPFDARRRRAADAGGPARQGRRSWPRRSARRSTSSPMRATPPACACATMAASAIPRAPRTRC